MTQALFRNARIASLLLAAIVFASSMFTLVTAPHPYRIPTHFNGLENPNYNISDELDVTKSILAYVERGSVGFLVTAGLLLFNIVITGFWTEKSTKIVNQRKPD